MLPPQDSRNYIRQKIREATSDPFGYFYLTIKIHKTPISTRPVCSDLASLPHLLGQWVDLALQPVVTSQPTYFKDSFALKRELNTLVIPPNASLFTYDAVSMYTNIEIDDCLERISTFLSTIWDRIECAAVISAMEIVMRNNRMRFGDLIFHQTRDGHVTCPHDRKSLRCNLQSYTHPPPTHFIPLLPEEIH